MSIGVERGGVGRGPADVPGHAARRFSKTHRRRRSGASATEYALVTALIGVCSIIAIQTVGTRLTETMCSVLYGFDSHCGRFSIKSLADLVAVADTNEDGVVADLEFMDYFETGTDMLFAVTCYSDAGCPGGYPVTQGAFDNWKDACNKNYGDWNAWPWDEGYQSMGETYTNNEVEMLCP